MMLGDGYETIFAFDLRFIMLLIVYSVSKSNIRIIHRSYLLVRVTAFSKAYYLISYKLICSIIALTSTNRIFCG